MLMKSYVLGVAVDATDSEAALPVVQVQETSAFDSEKRASKDSFSRVVKANQVRLLLEVLEDLDLVGRLPDGIPMQIESSRI
jgi:hypothetical protein